MHIEDVISTFIREEIRSETAFFTIAGHDMDRPYDDIIDSYRSQDQLIVTKISPLDSPKKIAEPPLFKLTKEQFDAEFACIRN